MKRKILMLLVASFVTFSVSATTILGTFKGTTSTGGIRCGKSTKICFTYEPIHFGFPDEGFIVTTEEGHFEAYADFTVTELEEETIYNFTLIP